MSGTSSSGGVVTSGGAVTSDIMFDGLTPAAPGGELQVSGSAALVDGTGHTVTLGGQSYSLGDVLEAIAARAVVAGSSGTDISNQPVAVGGVVTTISAALESDGIAVTTIPASGATSVPIPAIGDAYYVITATADSTLQFSGSPVSQQAQRITIEIPATTFNVLLPTEGVENMSGVPAAASSSRTTLVTYLSRSGSSTIVGGV